MRVLLLNVPHPSIGSSIADHLPPLGLLAVGGPLIDDEHEVRLLDEELAPRCEDRLLEEAVAFSPDAVLFGLTRERYPLVHASSPDDSRPGCLPHRVGVD